MKLFLILLLPFIVFCKPMDDTPESTLSDEEMKLYHMIMDYRKSYGLGTIPISEDLNFVAKEHAKDLQYNGPERGRCNMHSWSGEGDWSECCYTADHRNPECMWNKPGELTDYSGKGYEIAHWQSSGISAEKAFRGWKNSPGHNKVMINKGIWDEKWRAIGIGLEGQYATVWFGNESQ